MSREVPEENPEATVQVVGEEVSCLPWHSIFSFSFKRQRLRELPIEKCNKSLSTNTIPMTVVDDEVIIGPFGHTATGTMLEFDDSKYFNFLHNTTLPSISRLDFYSDSFGIAGIGAIYGNSCKTFHGLRTGIHHIVSLDDDNDHICQVTLSVDEHQLTSISMTSNSNRNIGPYGAKQGEVYSIGSVHSPDAILVNFSGIELNDDRLVAVSLHFKGLDAGLVKREMILYEPVIAVL